MNRRTLDSLPDVLTVEEAASVLRLSRNLTYEAIRTGQLPCVRIKRRILIPKAAILRLLSGAVPLEENKHR